MKHVFEFIGSVDKETPEADERTYGSTSGDDLSCHALADREICKRRSQDLRLT